MDLDILEIIIIIVPIKIHINTSKSSEKALFPVFHAVFWAICNG